MKLTGVLGEQQRALNFISWVLSNFSNYVYTKDTIK